MSTKDSPEVANPLPRNVQRSRYAGLQACWHVAVMLHENGEFTATLGKLDIPSKHMRFTQLSSGSWYGSADLEAAKALAWAAHEVMVDTSAQLRLF